MKDYKSITKTFENGADIGDIVQFVINNIETFYPTDPTEGPSSKRRYRIQIFEAPEADALKALNAHRIAVKKAREKRWIKEKAI
jgi:hypothetical protein